MSKGAVPLRHTTHGLALRSETFREYRRVVGGDAAGNQRTDGAQYGVSYGLAHLRDVLVGDGEVESILACLRQNSCEAVSCEVLELVNIKIEWPTIFDIRNIAATHSG